MPRIQILAGAIALGLFAIPTAHADDSRFDRVVAIGDSLSDSGNVAAAQGFPAAQRFTTNPGSTTVENVARGLGFSLSASQTGGNDYAWGGARVNHYAVADANVPSLGDQWKTYLAQHGGKADARTLYQVWGGANDISYLVASGSNATAIAANTAAVAQAEVALVAQMQAAGAKYVVVYNLPDLGKTPLSIAAGASAQASLSQLATIYNGVLGGGIAQLSTNGLNVVPVNTFLVLNEVVADPARYGFSNVTQTACTVANSLLCTPDKLVSPDAASTYVFADGMHPTTAAHALLGQYVLSIMRAPGYASLLGEAPLASIEAQNRAVREQMLADVRGSDTRLFANVDYGDQRFDGSAGSPRTSSNNVNLTIGADVRFNDNLSGGMAVNIGQHNADYAGGGGYKLQDVSGLGYLTWHQGGAYVGGYVNFGQNNFSDIERRIQLGDALRTETAKADGNHVGGGINGGYWFETNALRTGPFANLDWQTVKVGGYNEGSSDSTAMWFGSQQRDSQVSTLGWRLEGHWLVDGSKLSPMGTILSPYIELAYNYDSKADPRAIRAGSNSMPGSFDMLGFMPDKSWGTGNVGLNVWFTDKLNAWVAYSGRFGDSSQRYDNVNLGMKYAF